MQLKGFEYNFHSVLGYLYETDIEVPLISLLHISWESHTFIPRPLSSDRGWFEQSSVAYCAYILYYTVDILHSIYNVKMQLRD